MPKFLDEYRARRSAERTPEPPGASGERTASGSSARLFVVQKHDARRLHWDFRLELNGVLRSWAVPQGPSYDPADKRLAVEVEDHPIEYADFEGVIPAGNYGAGPVIVWDRGRWIPEGDPQDGYRNGKILFTLEGYKLRGVWQLVRTKRKRGDAPGPESKEWLLIKKPDAHAGVGRAPGEESVLSGLTLAEVADGSARAAALAAELARTGAPLGAVAPEKVELMKAEPAPRAFSDPAWLFELKYDGYRMLAGRAGARAFLITRGGNPAVATFPEIDRALRALTVDPLLLDGEVVCLDEHGLPSFRRLQKRALLTRPLDTARAAIELPATYHAFDVLAASGHDLRGLPLAERKELLRKLMPRSGPLRFVDHLDGAGEALWAEVERRGLEGLVAKRRDSIYRAGRSRDWLKIRALRTGDFAVVGFSAPSGARAGFGALHLAVAEGERLIYAGKVGTGFSADEIDKTRALLEQDRIPKPACAGSITKARGDVWVTPRLVCEVRFKEWIEPEGVLRQPSFLRFRDDKPIAECVREGPRQEEAAPPAASPAEAQPKAASFTNLGKTYWPDDGINKGDLIDYYRAISPWLLPWLADRPVVLTRYPDGIGGKNFFQKDAPAFVPEWVRTQRIWSELAQRDIDYFICDDLETLLYVANLGSIPLHVWSSRARALAQPDYCIIDLDPKGAPFAHVVEIALRLRALCDALELPVLIKTSGQSGLHLLVPLGGQCTYEESRALGELLSRVVEAELPSIATTVRAVGARKGRVYLDYLQNGHGRTIVAPFSVRPVPGAGVSTPLEWSEVGPALDPRRFTLRTVPARMDRLGRDPALPALALRPDLGRALALLQARMQGPAR